MSRNGFIGVVGGMGPMASAAFVRHVYGLGAGRPEQELPRILLDSDPGFPDRTTAIRTHREDAFVRVLEERIDSLVTAGAGPVVIACVTAHHFVERIDPRLRAHIVSLVTTSVDLVRSRPGRFLLLSTWGTRSARVFERETGWPTVADRIVLPGPGDQDELHRLIYQVKIDPDQARAPVLEAVERLRRRHGCDGVVLGCTEFHLYFADLGAQMGAANVVDGLMRLAEMAAQDGAPGLLATPDPAAAVATS